MQQVGETIVAARLAKIQKPLSNMAVQHVGLHGRGPAPYVDIRAHYKAMKTQPFLFSWDYTLTKTYV